jgi:hypothetical protein
MPHILYEHITSIYIKMYCLFVHVCPQISESASPMALEFGHNIAGEYARV